MTTTAKMPEVLLEDKVAKLGADALVLLASGRALVAGMIESEVRKRVEQVSAAEVAEHIDMDNLADCVAKQVDWSDYLPSASDLVEEVELGDVAEAIDLDYLAEAIDLDYLAARLDTGKLVRDARAAVLTDELLEKAIKDTVQTMLRKAMAEAEQARRERCWHRRLWRWLRSLARRVRS
jgi:hypothetical protein